MSATPMIDHVLASYGFLFMLEADRKALATELRALLAERDALAAKLPTPVRKLREYKGIVYDPGCKKWRDGPVHFNRAVDVVVRRHLPIADHAAIYALRDDPWERILSVEDVLLGIVESVRDGYAVKVEDAAAYLRAAVADSPAPLANGGGEVGSDE